MTLEEVTASVTKLIHGPMWYYVRTERCVIIAASDVFAIVPMTKRMCGMRVYESVNMPRSEVRVMRWIDAREILIAEDPAKREVKP